jgi:RimJ/RimL family protein N-acetyltransferase
MTSQRSLPLHRWTARPLLESDAALVFEVFNDPDVVRARSGRPPEDEAAASRWIGIGAERGDVRWVIERDTDHCFGGIVVLQGLDEDPRAAEAGCVLLPHARNLGLGTAALRVVTAWAFDELLLDRVWLVHDVDNAAACAAADRAGFPRVEGAFSSRRRADGSTVDQEMHARDRVEGRP